jgi:hypothetical protein
MDRIQSSHDMSRREDDVKCDKDTFKSHLQSSDTNSERIIRTLPGLALLLEGQLEVRRILSCPDCFVEHYVFVRGLSRQGESNRPVSVLRCEHTRTFQPGEC